MTFRKYILGCASILAFCGCPSIGHALQITGVAAPDLVRPSNNILLPFNITVSGTYGRDDQNLSDAQANRVLTAKYWDDDGFLGIFDDQIDITGVLTVPLGGAVKGNPWGPINVKFNVGCDFNGKVFGPSGATGEGPVMNDGYFKFTEGVDDFGSWGYNTVTCTNEPPPAPESGPLLPLQLVPGPLPIFGAYATYLWSKKLRNRICSSRKH
jgi:hypothetical protein